MSQALFNSIKSSLLIKRPSLLVMQRDLPEDKLPSAENVVPGSTTVSLMTAGPRVPHGGQWRKMRTWCTMMEGSGALSFVTPWGMLLEIMPSAPMQRWWSIFRHSTMFKIELILGANFDISSQSYCWLSCSDTWTLLQSSIKFIHSVKPLLCNPSV